MTQTRLSPSGSDNRGLSSLIPGITSVSLSNFVYCPSCQRGDTRVNRGRSFVIARGNFERRRSIATFENARTESTPGLEV